MKFIATILAGVAVSTSIASAQPRPQPGSHIKVTNCSVRLGDAPAQPVPGQNPNTGAMYTQNNVTFGKKGRPGITVGFTNTGQLGVATVAFTYESRGVPRQNVTYKGSVEPQASVTHRFDLAGDVSVLDTGGTCVVTHVQYADGTTWSNPTASKP